MRFKATVNLDGEWEVDPVPVKMCLPIPAIYMEWISDPHGVDPDSSEDESCEKYYFAVVEQACGDAESCPDPSSETPVPEPPDIEVPEPCLPLCCTGEGLPCHYDIKTIGLTGMSLELVNASYDNPGCSGEPIYYDAVRIVWEPNDPVPMALEFGPTACGVFYAQPPYLGYPDTRSNVKIYTKTSPSSPWVEDMSWDPLSTCSSVRAIPPGQSGSSWKIIVSGGVFGCWSFTDFVTDITDCAGGENSTNTGCVEEYYECYDMCNDWEWCTEFTTPECKSEYGMWSRTTAAYKIETTGRICEEPEVEP